MSEQSIEGKRVLNLLLKGHLPTEFSSNLPRYTYPKVTSTPEDINYLVQVYLNKVGGGGDKSSTGRCLQGAGLDIPELGVWLKD